VDLSAFDGDLRVDPRDSRTLDSDHRSIGLEVAPFVPVHVAVAVNDDVNEND
jgi:hypothetical protein